MCLPHQAFQSRNHPKVYKGHHKQTCEDIPAAQWRRSRPTKAKTAMDVLQPSPSHDSDRSLDLIAAPPGWKSNSIGFPAPEASYPYDPTLLSLPELPSLGDKRRHHESSSAARMRLSPKRRRTGGSSSCIIVPESALPYSSSASSLTLDDRARGYALRVNDTCMRQTPENILGDHIGAEGSLAIAPPMDSSPVRQPQKHMGALGSPEAALENQFTLLNGSEELSFNQHGMGFPLAVALDSGLSSESAIQLHSSGSSDASFHRLHDRTTDSTSCFTASGSTQLSRSHSPLLVPDRELGQHTDIDRASEQRDIGLWCQINEIERDLSATRPAPICSVATIDPCDVAWSALGVPLMEHQKEGLVWMKEMEESPRRGGILADDMGLGKTIQALALIVAHPSPSADQHATLVVTPAGLVSQWKHEIEQLLNQGQPRCRVFIYHGDNTSGPGAFHLLNQHDIVLTSFGTVAAELRRMHHQSSAPGAVPSCPALSILGPASKWHRVILDEAQCIKNVKSKTAIACSAINATYRWCLSGTPVMNTLKELFSLFKFLRIEGFCDTDPFNQAPDPALHGNLTHDRYKATAQLQDLVRKIMLRRTKTSTIHDRPILQLPVKTTENVYVTFNEEERKLYTTLESCTQLQFNQCRDGRTISRNASHMLSLLHRLRQACCHPLLVSNALLTTTGTSQSEERQRLDANAQQFSTDVVGRLRGHGNILECPICTDVVDNSIIFFPCGHSACEDCFPRIPRPAPSAQRSAGEIMAMRCHTCRKDIDPAKATDFVSFVKTHYSTASADSDSDNPLGPLGRLLEEIERHAGDGSDNVRGNARGALMGFVTGAEALTASAQQYHITPSRTNDSFGHISAWQRKQALANPTMKRLNREALGRKWMSSSKIDKALEIVHTVHTRAEGEKIIIFSQFTSFLDLVEVPLADRGWFYRRYDGSMKPTDRDAAVMDFSTNPDIMVLLVSLRAGNSGLNLTAASQVIILDPFWNPYVEEQAVGRVHRIGQRRPVHVHRILVPGTIEDRILDFQDKKRALIQGILGREAGMELHGLEDKDLTYLFGVEEPTE